jgi:hypothetical protein
MPIKGVVDGKGQQKTDAIILDGQQRITSLYYAIKSPDFPLKGSNTVTYFYVNFRAFLTRDESAETIVALDSKLSRDESFKRLLFPFYELESQADWVDGLEDHLLRVSSGDADKIKTIRRIIDRKLRHILDGFEIPYISLPETMRLTQVTEIFERINTAGKVLTVFDLLIARLSQYGIKLRELWEEATRRHPKLLIYSKTIDRIPIYVLQAIALSYSKTGSCKREDILNIYQSVSNETGLPFGEVWYEMAEYMDKAIAKLENLRADGFGVKDAKVVPFAPMIPILASLIKEIDSHTNKADCYTKLSEWYWASVFSNAYSGAVDSQLTSDFKEIKEWFSENDKVSKTVDRARRSFPTLNLSEVEIQSNAMYRGVLAILALRGANDFDTTQTVEHAKSNDRDHLFPKSEYASEKHVNSVLNITWMSKETNRRIKRAKKPSIYIKEFIEDRYNNDNSKFLQVLDSHLIGQMAYEYMLKDDIVAFLGEREKLILSRIKELIGIRDSSQEATLISPEKPFSNRLAIDRTLKTCEGYVHWVDKYFSKEGLEILSESLETDRVKEVKILLSIDKADDGLRSAFKRFRDEFKNSKVICEMRVIVDPKLKSYIHDRWIISKNSCFNLPSVDTIARGQFSEIKTTQNIPPFQEWWNMSKDIINDWNEVQRQRQKSNDLGR